MSCPHCGALAAEDAKFCEDCGTRLVAETAAPGPNTRCRCGAGSEALDAQGYCSICGRRQPAPPAARARLERDHIEIVCASNLAAVTDRGKRHAINQDDVVIERVMDSQVMIVCDGVSSAQDADTASRLAAMAMRDSLRDSLTAGAEVRVALGNAVRKAHEAVLTIPYQRDHETLGPPGTTLIAAVVQDQTLTVGWVGDSRAYWVTAGGAELLTRDHSWVNEMVDSGQMTEEKALRSSQAHAITRCIGPLNGDEPADVPEPSVASYPLPPDCQVIVCSDGLWNYVPTPKDLAILVQQSPETDALTLARHLVSFALGSGGRDNITAAVLSL